MYDVPLYDETNKEFVDKIPWLSGHEKKEKEMKRFAYVFAELAVLYSICRW